MDSSDDGVFELDSSEWRYQVLSAEEIIERMFERIRQVNEIVQIPPTTTRLLLDHLKWDSSKLCEIYCSGNPDKLFEEAGVAKPPEMSPIKGQGLWDLMPSLSLFRTEECQMCSSRDLSRQLPAQACKHRFCLKCWNQYLTTKIMGESAGQAVPCAAPGCDVLVDDQAVILLARDREVKLKYQRLITNLFVECDPFLRWCPRADCTKAIKVDDLEAQSVTCACGHVFCSACGENWHDPVKCNMLKRWNDDSESVYWIAVNTKACPKCHVAIEKDGAFNMITCTNQSCMTRFCWLCLGPHADDQYECNRFSEDTAEANRGEQEKSRAALKRYVFFFERYQNHMQSLNFGDKLNKLVKQNMDELQRRKMSWIDAQFLKQAVNVLCQCRQTLMYTYVFACYLKPNIQSVIFGENQRHLERATEKLSEYLEEDLRKLGYSQNVLDIKKRIQDKYWYCASRRQELLDHVHEGYDKDWWEYNDTIESSPK